MYVSAWGGSCIRGDEKVIADSGKENTMGRPRGTQKKGVLQTKSVLGGRCYFKLGKNESGARKEIRAIIKTSGEPPESKN